MGVRLGTHHMGLLFNFLPSVHGYVLFGHLLHLQRLWVERCNAFEVERGSGKSPPNSTPSKHSRSLPSAQIFSPRSENGTQVR